MRNTIYDIDARLRQVIENVDEETGEIDGELFDALMMEREAKCEGIALLYKEVSSIADEIKKQEAALKKRREAKEHLADRLKDYLSQALVGKTMETARVRVSYRKSTSVIINDPAATVDWLVSHDHNDCVKFKPPEPVKSEIKKLLKSVDVPGVYEETRQNIQIN